MLKKNKLEVQNKRGPTEEDLIVSWVGYEVLAVFRPVHVGDEAGVALRESRFTVHIEHQGFVTLWDGSVNVLSNVEYVT